MHGQLAAELLDVWERGAAHTPARRAVLLLEFARPDLTQEQCERVSVGRRDEQLFLLRGALFGDDCSAVTQCPACGESVEFSFASTSIHGAPSAQRELVTVVAGDYSVSARVPTGGDMIAASNANPDEIRFALLKRCVLEARRAGEPVCADELPEKIVDAIASSLADADPHADVTLALTCPQCAHSWSAIFDIVSFLWNEIHAWGMRTLVDVHELAATYGWTESEIVAMSAWRRQAYLDLIHA